MWSVVLFTRTLLERANFIQLVVAAAASFQLDAWDLFTTSLKPGLTVSSSTLCTSFSPGCFRHRTAKCMCPLLCPWARRDRSEGHVRLLTCSAVMLFHHRSNELLTWHSYELPHGPDQSISRQASYCSCFYCFLITVHLHSISVRSPLCTQVLDLHSAHKC